MNHKITCYTITWPRDAFAYRPIHTTTTALCLSNCQLSFSLLLQPQMTNYSQLPHHCITTAPTLLTFPVHSVCRFGVLDLGNGQYRKLETNTHIANYTVNSMTIPDEPPKCHVLMFRGGHSLTYSSHTYNDFDTNLHFKYIYNKRSPLSSHNFYEMRLLAWRIIIELNNMVHHLINVPGL